MKRVVKIDKIYRDKVSTKFGERDRFVLVSGNLGFKGWGNPEYKEGQVYEIEFDEKTEFKGKNLTYYEIIQKKDDIKSLLKEILERVKKIEEKVTTEIDLFQDEEAEETN